MTWVGTAAQLAVPLVALLSSSGRSVRVVRGRRYRLVLAFRPPLEGEREAWAAAARKAFPGAEQVTVTPRGGVTLLGLVYRAARSHTVEPSVTAFEVGGTRGVLERIDPAGEVQL